MAKKSFDSLTDKEKLEVALKWAQALRNIALREQNKGEKIMHINVADFISSLDETIDALSGEK